MHDASTAAADQGTQPDGADARQQRGPAALRDIPENQAIDIRAA